MKFDVLGLLAACSYALDCVEAELIKVTNNHSKRVAYMAVCTAEKNGYTGSKPAGSGRVCIAARQCSGTIYSGRASKATDKEKRHAGKVFHEMDGNQFYEKFMENSKECSYSLVMRQRRVVRPTSS